MKNKKRAPIKSAVKHQLNDQFASACAVCRDGISAKLEIHHIDGDTQNSAIENLMILCGGCHNEFTLGTRNEADARMYKRMAETGLLPSRKGEDRQPKAGDTITNNGTNTGAMAGTMHVENLTVNQKKERSGKAPLMPGTVGADADMRDYANYLAKRYIDWRKKGIANGIDRRRFSPASAQGILCEGFGAQSAHMIAQKRFFDWVLQAQRKIDATVWGKMNRHRNYHTWEEHLRERHGD